MTEHPVTEVRIMLPAKSLEQLDYLCRHDNKTSDEVVAAAIFVLNDTFWNEREVAYALTALRDDDE